MQKQVTYFYVRHGETIFNLQDRMQGITDSVMTEYGRAQVRAAAIALEDIPFTKAYTSPFLRTINTSKILLAEHDISAIPIDDLKEFNYGLLDGALKDPNDLDMVRRLRGDVFEDIGGDSRASMDRRIRRLFEKLNEECEDEDKVLLVSHGAYYRHLLRALFADVIPGTLDDDAELIPGGGVALFQFNDGGLDLIRPASDAISFKAWYMEHVDQLYRK